MLRRVWAPRGHRPVARVHPRYEWLSLYGFGRPTSGAVEWLVGNAVNVALFAAVLARFAEAVGAGRDKTVILVLDNAGWHGAGKLVPPEGVRLVFLPPYSSELQPAERLWPLTREAMANRSFASLNDLDQALATRCLTRGRQPDLVKAHAYFRWWLQVA